MRLYVGLVILGLLAITAFASFKQKPIEAPLLVSDHPSGPWLHDTAAPSGNAHTEMVDSFTCMRLLIPYEVTTDKREGITKT